MGGDYQGINQADRRQMGKGTAWMEAGLEPDQSVAQNRCGRPRSGTDGNRRGARRQVPVQRPQGSHGQCGVPRTGTGGNRRRGPRRFSLEGIRRFSLEGIRRFSLEGIRRFSLEGIRRFSLEGIRRFSLEGIRRFSLGGSGTGAGVQEGVLEETRGSGSNEGAWVRATGEQRTDKTRADRRNKHDKNNEQAHETSARCDENMNENKEITRRSGREHRIVAD
ncbi:hypothetical protein SKAU_G00006920 [Synaphobranchus kaupii]|uniref:Uncharacterized protein n=1 Tax=Synaphobranchus kaupii TaxID=118154 RepID=A0A9Q1GAG5_SYNKA|nr:hypothetical protein SKAU_G00006920 [Synaphobranchus kaupii]